MKCAVTEMLPYAPSTDDDGLALVEAGCLLNQTDVQLDDLVFAATVYCGGGLDGNDPIMPVLEPPMTDSLDSGAREMDDMPMIEFDDMPPRYLSVLSRYVTQ